MLFYLIKTEINTLITLKTFSPNVNVPETTFAFDAKKYPGVEVVEFKITKSGNRIKKGSAFVEPFLFYIIIAMVNFI